VFKILVDLPALAGLRAPFVQPLIDAARAGFPEIDRDPVQAVQLSLFLVERFEFVLESRGFDVRNVRAITRGRPFSSIRPSDELKKLKVLPEFTETPEFQELAIAFKRAKNISKELPDEQFRAAEAGGVPIDVTVPAERVLLDEIERRRGVIEGAVGGGDGYREAFAEAARFKPAVDRFFQDVLVMDPNPTVRANRLRLLRRLQTLILNLADISEIVPEETRQV